MHNISLLSSFSPEQRDKLIEASSRLAAARQAITFAEETVARVKARAELLPNLTAKEQAQLYVFITCTPSLLCTF